MDSEEGSINATEGDSVLVSILVSGFAYGNVTLRISALTYSEYAARGFNLEDEFDPSVIPMDAADGMPQYSNCVC